MTTIGSTPAITGRITSIDTGGNTREIHEINIPIHGTVNDATVDSTTNDNHLSTDTTYPLGSHAQLSSLVSALIECKDSTNTYLTQLMTTHQYSNNSNKHSNNNTSTSTTSQAEINGETQDDDDQ